MDGLPISAIWKISIHTPTRGATNIVAAQQLHNIISIHTPAWGATELVEAAGRYIAFQSTLPRGERRIQNCICSSVNLFQSTLPRGERLNAGEISKGEK